MAYAINRESILDRVSKSLSPCKCGADVKIHTIHHMGYELGESLLIVCKNGHRGSVCVMSPMTMTIPTSAVYVDKVMEMAWKWNNPFPTVEQYMEHYA